MVKNVGIVMLVSWVFVLFSGMGLFSAEVNNLTLEKAIDIALRFNITLQKSSNQLRLSQISVKQKKSNFLPDLGIYARSIQLYSKDFNQATDEYSMNGTGSFSSGISSNFNLFNGFYDSASLKQSILELKGQEKTHSRTRQFIVFETVQRFIDVVTARELIKVEKENLEAQQLQLKLVEAFHKAGRRPIADVYQQKAEISSAEYRIINAERNYNVTKLLLLQTLGLEPGATIQLTAPEIGDLIKGIIEINQEDIIKEAFNSRPDLQAREQFLEAAQKGIKAAQSGYWPKLSLSIDLSTNYNSVFDSYSFSDQFFDNNINGSVALSLSVPVFDKFMTKHSVASARVKKKNEELEMERLRQQVELEVRQAKEDFRSAKKQINVTDTQSNYTLEALNSVKERYNVNVATMVELTQARTRHLESLYNQAKAKYNLLLKGISMTYYKGDDNSMISVFQKTKRKDNM